MVDGASAKPSRTTNKVTLTVGALAFATAGFGLCKITSPIPSPASQTVPTPIEVHFSPPQGGNANLAEVIGQAKREILVQAYIFNSWEIRDALIQARWRNSDIKVKVILD